MEGPLQAFRADHIRAFWPPVCRSPTRNRARMRSHASPLRTGSPARPGMFRRCGCVPIAPGPLAPQYTGVLLVAPTLSRRRPKGTPDEPRRRLPTAAGRRHACSAGRRLSVERTSGCIGDYTSVTSSGLVRPVASASPCPATSARACSLRSAHGATWSVGRTSGHCSISTP
jgi:hypothetical protein